MKIKKHCCPKCDKVFYCIKTDCAWSNGKPYCLCSKCALIKYGKPSILCKDKYNSYKEAIINCLTK